MSHYPEDWCKIWQKTGLLFQKWQEFGEFWPELSKVSKICKVFNVWLKKVQRSYLSWHWIVIQYLKKNLLIWKWHEEYGKFSSEHLKVSILGLWGDPLIESRKSMSLKFREELFVMAMKNDAKFEGELTFHFKIDMRNLKNFDSNTQRGVIFHDTEEWYKIW